MRGVKKYFAYFSYRDLRRIPNVIVQKDRIIRGLSARPGKGHELLRAVAVGQKRLLADPSRRPCVEPSIPCYRQQ